MPNTLERPFAIDLYATSLNVRTLGQSHVLAAPDYLADTPFSSPLINLFGLARRGAEAAAKMIEQQYPQPQTHEKYARDYLSSMAAAIGTAVKEIGAARKAAQEAWAGMLRPSSAISEIRLFTTMQSLAARKPGELVNLMLADENVAAVAFENWHLLELPAGMRPQLERDVAQMNVTRRFARTLSSSPSLADMFGERVDHERAAQAATDAIAKVDNALTDTDAGAAWVRSAIGHVAVLADTGPEAVWSQAMAA